VLGLGAALFAQVDLPEHYFAAGNWALSGNRLYQNDATAGLAKMNLRSRQSGPMIYEFNARYEGGAEDGHGGFGLHIFADNVVNRASWGSGASILLWLNYDEKPINRNIPRGLSAQVYRSVSNSQMDLIQSVDLNYMANILYQNLSDPIPFSIWADGNTGEVRVYDPSDANGGYYYYFVDKKFLPLRGNWVSLRTNGMKMSFTN
jgi:hypothetical protein